jgi:hypothetical protein
MWDVIIRYQSAVCRYLIFTRCSERIHAHVTVPKDTGSRARCACTAGDTTGRRRTCCTVLALRCADAVACCNAHHNLLYLLQVHASDTPD